MKKNSIYYIFIAFLLITIAGFRLFGWANDTENYYSMVVYQDELLLSTKELFFRLIIFLNSIFFNTSFTVFLLIFAILGVGLKIYAFKKYSQVVTLSIFLYLLSYYWLQDYIQIRAGVATGVFLLAIEDLNTGNFKKYFFKVFVAIMFHWSSLLLIPLYFIVRYTQLRIFMLLPFLSILLYKTQLNINEFIIRLIEYFGIDMSLYKMYAGYQNTINVFNFITISYVLIFTVITIIIIKYRKLFTNYEITLYKIYSFSISIFYFLALLNAPVVSFRVIEYFNIVLLLLLPAIVVKFKQKIFISSLCIIFFGFYFWFLFNRVIEFS